MLHLKNELTKVLCVIINYQNWELTCDCIQSLLNANVPGSNILVIDNASPNGSLLKIQKMYPDLIYLQNSNNIGFAAANNQGIKIALERQAHYSILLNNDTEVKPDSIINLINEMNKQPDMALGTGRVFIPSKEVRIWYDGGKLISWRGMAKHFNYNVKVSAISLETKNSEVNFISGCFMCIRMNCIPRLGLLDERFFMYLEDIEYCARAAKNNLKMLFVPASEIYHKVKQEENYNLRVIYYSLRNRLLLIELTFSRTASIYVRIVLLLKRIYWFVFDKSRYKILIIAIRDYKNKYYGELINELL